MRKKKKATRSTKKKKEDVEMQEYVYSFEIIRHYPSTRSFIMKAPLKSSIKGTFVDLLFGKKRE